MGTTRNMAGTAVVVCGLAALAVNAEAQQIPLPAVSEDLAVPAGTALPAGVSPALFKSKGTVNVWVTLERAPLAVAQANANENGQWMNAEEQRSYLEQLHQDQDLFSVNAAFFGAQELGRVEKVHNSVAYLIDAENIAKLAAQPGVVSVSPVIDPELALSETVPYIGAATVQNLGYTGAGIRVAVLDTGIDYTHKNLGGSGTAADYTEAYGTSTSDERNKTVNPNLFPTDKVIGGFDFVGETWVPGRLLVPDPNPIDCGPAVIPAPCAGGHGTHVADIVAGHSKDGTHKGVAPDARMYAVKVCSAISTSCSGVAILQGLDFALDPDGDGDVSDAADVISISIGSNYGQKESVLVEAAENAARFGVVVVIAAGNAGDKPYIVSGASVAPAAISVAQTQVPSAKFFPLVIDSPALIAGTYGNTATVDWAPIGNGFVNQPVVFVGRGCPAGSIGPTDPDDPYLADPARKIALIDRGACSVSAKVDRAARAGANGVLLGLVAPGDAVSFSLGGGSQFVPTLVIIQSYANLIKQNLTSGVKVTVRDSSPLVGSMVNTSSRGPSYSYQTIKPEIGAPGASVSALAGTAIREGGFGGTSGATPMISGSAALLLQAFQGATVAEIKARLMNNTETRIFTAPNIFGAQLAPATRIGSGEVRVDRALRASTLAWVPSDETAAVSFGYAALPEPRQFQKTIQVYNASENARTYTVSADFRDPSGQATAAAEVAPSSSSIEIPAGGRAEVAVTLSVDPSKLFNWTLNGGNQGGNGAQLTRLELDGHITFSDAKDTLRLPWTFLGHKAADVRSESDQLDLLNRTGTLTLSNFGATAGRVEVFAWTGSSRRISVLPGPGDSFAVINLHQVGVRLVSLGTALGLQFAIHTFGKRSHPNYPAEFDICINTDPTCRKSGFVVFNQENGGFGATGQNVVTTLDLTTGRSVTAFFADADLNSSTMIMTVPLSALPGITPTSKISFSVLAFDNYFTGSLTDAVEGMSFTPGTPRFTATSVPAAGVPVGGSATLTVTEVPGGGAASPSQTGLLLIYRDPGNRQAEAIAVGTNGDQS